MSMMFSASGRTAPVPQGQIQSNVRMDIDGLDMRTRFVKGILNSHYIHIFERGSDDDNHIVANESLWSLNDIDGLDAAQWPMCWSTFNNYPIPVAELKLDEIPAGADENTRRKMQYRAEYKYLLRNTRFIGFSQTDMNFTRRVGPYDKPANGTAIHHGIVQTVNTGSREIRAGQYVRIRPPGKPVMVNGKIEREQSINTKSNGILPTKALAILEAVDPNDYATFIQDVRDYMGAEDTYQPTIEDIFKARDHLPPVIGVANTTAVNGGDFVELRVFFKAH